VSKFCALLKAFISHDFRGFLCENVGPGDGDHEGYCPVGGQAELPESSVKGAIHYQLN
jgi:hypothetical protein